MHVDSRLEEVALGVIRVPIALPDNPMGEVNSYFILGPERTTVVDVGYNHPQCIAALDEAMGEVGRSWDSADIILTHSHADHIGGLDHAVALGAQVFANMHSFQEVLNLQDMQAAVFNPLLKHLVEPGQYDEREAHKRDARDFAVSSVPVPENTHLDIRYLDDGDRYENGEFALEAITTPGHDDWHICLYEPRLKMLFSGDHLLEHTTPGIMTWMVAYDVLDEYFRSLDKTAAKDIDLILPGHGIPFADTAKRVAELKEFHSQRLEEFFRLVSEGHSSLIDIARHATWRHADWDDWTLLRKFLSLGETFAHLVYLINEAKVTLTVCQNKYRFYDARQWNVSRV